MSINVGTRDLGAIAKRAMIDRGLEPEFPADAVRQLDGIAGPSHESDGSIRDFRKLLWCSIDNDSSMDLDQLSVAEELPGGAVKVLVAIADVDALVKPATPIDRHASKNTCSVYTPARIFPMLPEKLSTDYTSLADDQDRIAMVIEMSIAADGSVTSSDVYRGLVHNRAKLAYRSVAAWLEGQGPAPERLSRVPGLEDNLRIQDRIAQAMRKVRYQHGSLDLDTIEPEAVLSGGNVVDLRVARKNRAKQLIEDLMIAANGVTARFLEKKGWPAIQRVVRTPKHWDGIVKLAAGLHETLPARPDAKALAEFMTRRKAADALRFPDLSLSIVKLLGAGEYVVQAPNQEAGGHFGLAVDEYSHSTAPNRRYPDLITQRLVKAALAAAKSPYSLDELTSLATHCTEQEDAAKKVERQLRKSAAALYLSARIGETFDSLVTGAAEKGTWVRIVTPPAEGRLMDAKKTDRVGDKLRVKLVGLNVERGFIDFVHAK
jgi:exoribonuclease-2